MAAAAKTPTVSTSALRHAPRAPYRARHRVVVMRATTAKPPASTALPTHVSHAVDMLTAVAAAVKAGNSLPPTAAVYESLVVLEQAKLQPGADWPATIGGAASPGRRWRLLYSNRTNAEVVAREGKFGRYFPVLATYCWDASTGDNGAEFRLAGGLASLSAQGTYKIDGKVIGFELHTLTLRLAFAKLSVPLRPRRDPSTFEDLRSGLYFDFFYMDDRIVCARGRNGGVAMWARADGAGAR